ncbi:MULTISPECIES: hypothetical protein [Bacillus cereus group]|uniref:hypothetical protein n=1 Tax=Bacillus cereus group TaxID=86661 RepID=UPI001596C156|nr:MULTISPECIES: hypothetical protein [Bacillus cereus group]
MFWRKQKRKAKETTILGHYKSTDLEITRVRTSKPIKTAKSGIKIENLPKKR